MLVLTLGFSEVRAKIPGRHNALEIFTVKRNIFPEISKVLLNDAFAEFDRSSRIKNNFTDRLNLSGL